MSDDVKYKEILITDEEVLAVGNMGSYASYRPGDDKIYVKKGKMSLSEFGINASWESDTFNYLNIIHERQHQLDHHAGVDASNYKDLQKDEFKAHLAGAVTLFRMLRETKSEEEFCKIVNDVKQDGQYDKLITDLQMTGIDLKTDNPEELNKLLGGVKDSTYNYLFSNNGGPYVENWQSIVATQIEEKKGKINLSAYYRTQSNSDLVIGGFDFSKVGDENMEFPTNKAIESANFYLKKGVDYKKVNRFLTEASELPVDKAESLNLSGLSREQAMQVLQTAIVAQNCAQHVTEATLLGNDVSLDFNFIGRNLKESTAIYLDMKLDALEKEGKLNRKGNDEKFELLMKEAKQVKIDGKKWFENNKKYLGSEDIDKYYANIGENDGKIVSFDDYISNASEMKAPLLGTSVKEVLADIDKKAEESRKFWEEYERDNPNSSIVKGPKYSEPYKVRVVDFESDVLKDEFGYCLNQGDDKVRREVGIVHTSSVNIYGKPVGRISSFPRYEVVENGQVVDSKYIVRSAEEMQSIKETLIQNGKISENIEGNINDFYASDFSYGDKTGVYLVPEEWIKDYCKIKDREDIARQKGEPVCNPKGPSQALRFDMKIQEREKARQEQEAEKQKQVAQATKVNGYSLQNGSERSL